MDAERSLDLPTPLIWLVIVLAAAWSFRHLPDGHFQTETDVVRANASRTMAEWLPNVSETAMMINAPALAASGTLLPGVWLYHFMAQWIAGPNASHQLFFALFIHLLVAFSVGSLCAALTESRRGHWAGLIYALHPAVAAAPATYANGPRPPGDALGNARRARLHALHRSRLRRASGRRGAVRFSGGVHRRRRVLLFVLVAAIEITQRRRGRKLHWTWRMSAVGLCVAAALGFYAILAAAGIPVRAPSPLQEGFWMSLIRSHFYAFRALVLPGLGGKAGFIVAALLGSCVPLAAVYRSLEKPDRLLPAALFPIAVLISLGEFRDTEVFIPGAATAYLAPVLLAALVGGDLLAALKSRAGLATSLAALVGFLSTSATLQAQAPIARGEQVRRLGDDIEKLYKDLENEADIYLIDNGEDRDLLLAAHLDFVYRYGLTRQTRMSFVSGGLLFPADARSPVGQIGPIMRLELTRAMIFIGWKTGHEGLTLLNDDAYARLDSAEQAMQMAGRFSEAFPIGGEDALKDWEPRLTDRPLPATDDTIHWFLEAQILRLHPTIGVQALKFSM
ncbi:MAG: hypothetical protein M5R36_24175 [Deltaproteobacteria bacterium]|nr:hypothetical protein [Deltaproteobacteria bacterium]